MLTLRKYSKYFFYSMFLFMTGLLFTWMFNGIRQFLVVAVVFMMSDWIVKKKTILFMIVILLLSTIHFTALIMIPMYFIVTVEPFGKKTILFLGLLLLAILFLDPFVSTVENLLSETAYGGTTAQFAQDDGVNIIRVMVMLVTPTIAFLGRKIIKQKNDRFLDVCVNMSVVCAGIYMLGMFTSGILVGRLPVYFEIYNLILLPYLLKECFTKSSSRLMFVLCTIGFWGFYWLQMRGWYYISDITGIL